MNILVVQRLEGIKAGKELSEDLIAIVKNIIGFREIPKHCPISKPLITGCAKCVDGTRPRVIVTGLTLLNLTPDLTSRSYAQIVIDYNILLRTRK